MSDLNCVFQSRLSRIAIAVLVLSTTLLSVDLSRTSDTTEAASFVDWNSPRVYFPDSGQAIGGAFLQKWAFDLKDLDLGSPVTPAVEIEGAVVQWLEYGRLEYRARASKRPQPTLWCARRSAACMPNGWDTRAGFRRSNRSMLPAQNHAISMRPGTRSRTISSGSTSSAETKKRLGAPISEEFDIGRVNYQFFEYGAMAWDNVNGTRVIPLGRLDASLYGLGNAADDYAPGDVYYSSASMLDLSDAFPGERWIEIDLTEHEIIAWVGDFELMRTEAVTGPIQSPTPTGTFAIYLKYEIQNLSGIGWNGQPYSAPGTPWVMYFHLDYAVHGSTWRTTYGFGSGQGCVIPPNEAAEKLWKWADYGTKVWVHY
ncbi:MAG: L,D-transpeptidase [Thermomicrobiales bacterium]